MIGELSPRWHTKTHERIYDFFAYALMEQQRAQGKQRFQLACKSWKQDSKDEEACVRWKFSWGSIEIAGQNIFKNFFKEL